MSYYALRGLSLLLGLANFVGMAGAMTFRDRALFAKPSKKEQEELVLAQRKFWDLSEAPLGLKHDFFTLRNGVKLHYVVNPGVNNPKNVTIFIHGFPDSWVLWRHLLTSPQLAQSSILIGVDLPGFGGSDGLPTYGPEQVLETMTAFILGIREQYLQEGGKAYIVSHDWGGIIAARLAAEAPQLVDRFIIASAVLPHQLYSNFEQHVALCKQMLHTWIRWPFSRRLLKKAFQALSPVLSQAGRSFYIFIFNLPKPIADFFGRMGNYWFLRIMHNVQAGNLNADGKIGFKVKDTEAAEYMAVSTGPGKAQFSTTTKAGGEYPQAAYRRISDKGWSEKIRLYREGLLLKPWEKSIETVVALSELDQAASSPRRSSSGAGLFEDGPPGSLKAPATVIYGFSDPAFDSRLCLDGMSDYLARSSQVVKIDKAGHWLPFEKGGRTILETVTAWAVEGEKENIRKVLGSVSVATKVLVEK